MYLSVSQSWLLQSELKKEIDTYPAEESSITKAYGATVRNVQERLASFTNQFGIEFVKPFSDEIYSALDREYKDSIQQNIDASKAACIGARGMFPILSCDLYDFVVQVKSRGSSPAFL